MKKGKQKPKRVIPNKVRVAASVAMQGNDWWNLRSKHGRDKLFASADLLWEGACEYFQWCVDNPFKEQVWVAGKRKTIDRPQPFTLEGVCLYLDASTSYFRAFKSARKNTGKDKDFLTVITKIEETVRTQQYSKSAVGFFNANLVSRYLGLIDKQDVTSGGNTIAPPNITVYSGKTPPLSDDEGKVDIKGK